MSVNYSFWSKCEFQSNQGMNRKPRMFRVRFWRNFWNRIKIEDLARVWNCQLRKQSTMQKKVHIHRRQLLCCFKLIFLPAVIVFPGGPAGRAAAREAQITFGSIPFVFFFQILLFFFHFSNLFKVFCNLFFGLMGGSNGALAPRSKNFKRKKTIHKVWIMGTSQHQIFHNLS